MTKRTPLLLLTLFLLFTSFANAQFGRRRGMILRPRFRVGRMQRMSRGATGRRSPEPKYDPALYLSLGYSYPNLDKNSFPSFYGYTRGTPSQTGPITACIDYRFSREVSIGVLVTNGSVTAPYYTASAATPAFRAKLSNWSFLLNLVRYLPAGKTITPYFRTAIGVNVWKQDYTDANGNKVLVSEPDLPDLAYQLGFGAKFSLTKNAGFYLEAGYGKYILNGGLSLKF